MKTTFLEFEQPIAELEAKIEELRYVQDDSALDISEEIARLQKKSHALTKEIYGKLDCLADRAGRAASRSVPTRSTTFSGSSPTSKSCTATARSRTTRRSSADSRASAGSPSW